MAARAEAGVETVGSGAGGAAPAEEAEGAPMADGVAEEAVGGAKADEAAEEAAEMTAPDIEIDGEADCEDGTALAEAEDA